MLRTLKRYWLSSLFLLLAVVCAVSYISIGSYVDEEGVLREPFGFIPLFWLFLLLSGLSFLATLIKKPEKTGHQ